MSTRLALLLACAALSCLWFRPADCHSDNGGDGDDQVCPQESHLSEQVPDQVRRAVADGERAFAVRLIKSVFKDLTSSGVDSNVLLSPASVYQTLFLAYFGARGETAAELEGTMGLRGLSRREVVADYLRERALFSIRDRREGKGYELTHANKFYFDRSLRLRQCLAERVLREEMEALDMTGRPEKARKHINRWVSERTRDRIPELLKAGSLRSSRLAVVNAAYFKGNWNSQFDPAETKTDNFYVRRDKIRKAEFMEQKGKFNYYTSEELRAHVLEMPYAGDEVSMVVILPPFEDDSIRETVSRLTPETLRGVMAEVASGFYSVDELTVKFPKFKFGQRFELVPTLQKLGLETLFDSHRSDLSGFLEKNSTDAVNVERAVHQTTLEVNEEGSEAAAATTLFGFRSARPLFHTQFIADHPFVFLIYDKTSDTVLFFGVFMEPESS